MLQPFERRALRAVAVQFFVNGAVFASFVPRLPEIRDRINVDLRTIGLLLTIGGLSGLLGSALVERVVAGLGTRRTIIASGICMVGGLPLMGIATTPTVFLIGYSAVAMFDVFNDISMNIQGSRLSARRDVPIMNRLHGLWSVGTVIGGIVSARVTASGISLATHLVVVACLLLGVVAIVARDLLRTDDPPAPLGPDAPVSSASRSTRRTGLIFAVLGCTALFPEIGTSDWITFRATDDLGISAGSAGLGFVAFTSGMVIGRFSGDSAQLRFGVQQTTQMCIGLASLGILIMALIPWFPATLAGAVITGLGVSVLFPTLYDSAAKSSGKASGALGAMSAGTRFGVISVPFLIGGLAGSPALGVGQAMALVTLPALATVWFVSRRAVR